MRREKKQTFPKHIVRKGDLNADRVIGQKWESMDFRAKSILGVYGIH